MKPLPHGWTEQYAVRHLLEQVDAMTQRLAFLETEVARLDAEKQGKRGPKPKPTAQGDARSGDTQ